MRTKLGPGDILRLRPWGSYVILRVSGGRIFALRNAYQTVEVTWFVRAGNENIGGWVGWAFFPHEGR